MKFGNVNMEFGIAKVFINSIDTEKAHINCQVHVPIMGGTLKLIITKGADWAGSNRWSTELHWNEDHKPEPEGWGDPDDESNGDDDPDDESNGDDDA